MKRILLLSFLTILSIIGYSQVSLSTLQSIVMLKGDNSSVIFKEIKKILEPHGFKINDDGKWVKIGKDTRKEIININLNTKGNVVAYEAINLPAIKSIVLQIREMENFVLVNNNDENIWFKNSSKNFMYQAIYEEDYNRCMIAISITPELVMDGPSTFVESGMNKTFLKVEIEPAFPGGNISWKRYLQNNLNYKIPVDNDAPAGRYTVIVRFIVSKSGEISDIVAESNNGYGMENEVIRVIKKGPKWKPGVQDGNQVNAYKTQPVMFVVSEKRN